MKGPGALTAVPLAQRMHAALSARGDELYDLLHDPSTEVVMAALSNPHLCEDHLLTILKRRDLPSEVFARIDRLEKTSGSRTLRLALARHPGIPPRVLTPLLSRCYLFDLLELCLFPELNEGQRDAVERRVVQQFPVLPAGDKLALARRGTAGIVEALLKEGDERFFEACLDNPRLQERGVLAFLRSPKATAATISAIGRSTRWRTRPAVRVAILANPATPTVWHVVFARQVPTRELAALAAGRKLPDGAREVLAEELRRRKK